VISAEAQLDISQFLKGTQQLQAAAQQLNRSLEDIKPAAPRLDNQPFVKDADQARVAIRAFIGEFGGLPGISAGASASLLGVGSSATAMGAGVASAAAITVAGLTAAAKAASDLQFEVAAVKSIKLDLDTAAATASIRDLSTQVGQSSASLAKSLYDIFSSINIPQEQAVRLLEQFSKGAVAAQTDAKTFGTSLIGALNAFGKSTEDAGHFADVFFNVVRDGVVTGQQLAAGLGPLAASAKNAGVSFEELGALIAGTSKQGGDAAQNLNNLNNLLAKLVTKETAQDFAALGISLEDATGKIRSPIAILADLKVKLDAMTESARASALQNIFPDLQARAAATVILNQLDFINTQLATNRTEVGSAEKAYKTMADTSKASLDRLKESVAALAGEVGDSLTPAIAESAEGWARALAVIRNDIAETRRRLQEAGVGFTPPEAKTSGVAQTAAQALGGDVGKQTAFAPRAAEVGGAVAAAREFAKLEEQANFAVTQFGLLGDQAAVQFFAAFAKAVAEQNPKLAQDFGEIVHTGASGLAGIWATATGDTTAAEAAFIAQMTATARVLLPGMGEAFYAALQEHVIAKAKTAFDSAGDVTQSFVSKLREGLTTSAEIAGQVLQKKLSLDTILANPQASEAAIAALFKYQTQLGTVETAITALTDRGLAAHLKTLINQIALTDDVSEKERLWAEAMATSSAAIDAQTRGHNAATAAAAELVKPLDQLASAVFPRLTAAQIAHVKEVENTEGHYAAMAEAAKLAGVDLGQFGDVTQLTGKQLAEAAQSAAALAKGFDGFLTDEQKNRFSSVLGTLAGATDTATAAQAKMLEAAGKTDEALALLLQHAGASPGAIGALKQALEEGGAAAVDAREKIAALTTFARDQAGVIRLKVDVDIEAAERALGKLQQDFREANAQRAAAETKATREFSEQQSATAQAQSKLGADYATSVQALSRARTDSGVQLGRDLTTASAAANAATSSVENASRKAMRDFQMAAEDAQTNLQSAFLTAQKTYTDGITALNEQAAAAVEQSATRQADAMRQAGQAMTAAALSTLATINQQSIAREDLNLRQLQGGTPAEQNQLAIDRVRLEASQGFQNAQSALAQQQARDQLAQDQLKADKDLNKTMQDLAKQVQKLVEQQQAAQFAAKVDFANATNAANRALGIAQVGESAFFASNQRQVSLVKGQDGTIFRLEQDVTLPFGADDLQLGGLVGQQRAAEQAAERGRAAAFEDSRQRQKALDEQAQAEQQKRADELIRINQERVTDPEGKGRTKAEQAFEEAEKARRKEQRDADKQFQEQQKALQVQLDTLAALKRLEGKLDRPNVTAHVTAVQETSKDMLTKAAQVAALRLRV
jgi:TP901 family phage tail tape measure protein